MGREKASEDTDVGFEYLWFRVHVEGHIFYDIANGVLEPRFIVKNDERIERIN